MELTKRELGIILWSLEVLPTMDVPMSLSDEKVADNLIKRLRKDEEIKKEYSKVDNGNEERLRSEGCL